MPINHDHFMQMALEEAGRSNAEGNVAVGSVLVQDDAVVARGRNLVTSTHDPTAHAETVALREAGSSLQQVDFTGCVLYTTFEPCPMCCGAILNSNISMLVMGARHDPTQAHWAGYTVEKLIDLTGRRATIEVVTGVLVPACFDIWRASTADR